MKKIIKDALETLSMVLVPFALILGLMYIMLCAIIAALAFISAILTIIAPILTIIILYSIEEPTLIWWECVLLISIEIISFGAISILLGWLGKKLYNPVDRIDKMSWR